MKVIKPDYYDEFKCVSSDCKDTCCKGWEIIVDEKTYNKYKELNDEYKHDLFKNIATRNSERVIMPKKDNECPFLNESGLCDIYEKVGKDYLCQVCTKYPRFENIYANECDKGLFMSCMPVAELIAHHTDHIRFIETEEERELNLSEIDADLYMALKQIRGKCIDIVQDRQYDIKTRVFMLLDYAKKAQKCISKGKYNGVQNITIDDFAQNGCSEAGNKDLKNVISTFLTFEILTMKWKILLEEIFEFASVEKKNANYCNANVYENFLVYMIYGYLLDAVYDKNLSGRVNAIISCMLIIAEVDRFRGNGNLDIFIDTIHLFSKEIEHCEENVAQLFNLARGRTCFKDKSLARMISRLNF